LTDENYFLESVSQKAVQRFGLAVLCHSYAKQELEIWGKAQRESTWRPKSDWGKLGGGQNFPGIKVTWPELKCIGIRRTRIVDLG